MGLTALAVVAGLFGVFLLLFVGGMLAAAWEVHCERRAGVPVTRPAWDARRARKASGGRRATVRGYWKGLRS